jgi:hypothetical protein
MLLNLFAGLFRNRRPLCKQMVHEHGGTAVRRFGKWYCSEMHADLYELELYEALRTSYCRHVGCQSPYVPWPEAVNVDCSPKQHATLTHLKEDRHPC